MAGYRFSIAVLTKNRTNPAYVGARIGADRIAAAAGGEARHYVPSEPDDVAEQIALVGQAVRDGADAIVIAPAHPTALVPPLNEAYRAGLPIVTLVSRIDWHQAVCHVGSDDAALAAAITHHLCGHLGGVGRLAYIGGHPDSSTSHDRERGFRQALLDWPKIRCVAEAGGLYQREPARRAMAEIIAEGHAVDGVVAANDFMAAGVLDALDGARQRLPVVGVNAVPEAVKAIRHGRLLASAAFDAMAMACIATEAAIRALRGEAVPREIELPVEIVDATNAARWDKPYEERDVPEWEDVAGM